MSRDSLSEQSSSRERMARVQMINLHCRRLRVEAQGCSDLARLDEIEREMQVLYDSIVAIREEQIMEDLPKLKRRRRWLPWRQSVA